MQQSVGRRVAPLSHIILIPSQPFLDLSKEATNTNFIVFGPEPATTSVIFTS